MSAEQRQGTDTGTLESHFGRAEGLLPLWIAEPGVDLAPPVVDALRSRAAEGWYGYETRPSRVIDSFWTWMAGRHGWDEAGLQTLVSPSIGTSIGILIQELTQPGDGVILQPPVFTDFKTLVASSGRTVARNALLFESDRYRIDFDGLAATASDPRNRVLILCSPHNPVGRVWTYDELATVATICAENDVFVVADEIHADIMMPGHQFVPFARAATGSGAGWAATHGPIKTFGLAGVCDTLLITSDEGVAGAFQSRSSQLHLTRNNVFGLAAFEAAYQQGGEWFDQFVLLLAENVAMLRERLPEPVSLVETQGTYLAWLDLRGLGLDVPEVARWLASEAGMAVSPGHWFGREGAGFARVTIAVPPSTIEQAIEQLVRAVNRA
ncbi:MAG: aminotransferase class I/II-fold pyridoxal phosphate-dependent enzyme [Actinomycetia bacterium]|nr:aminotransferase class I/II-fold pyridoxal phosphate-dependent enzyme [Actinomycetes bacterium]